MNYKFFKKIRSILVGAIVIASLFAFSALADTTTTNGGPAFHYVFHLYYDNGQLNADRDFQFKYDVVPDVFLQDSLGQFPYRGEIINFLGQTSADFKFDPKAGKNSVKAPYVADGQKAIFYDTQNQPILTIPVSESSFCNDDGICDADRGEDFLSCSNDCRQSSLPTPVPVNNDTSSTRSSGLWSGILYTLGGIILLGLFWWLFKRSKGSSSLPTPPPPPNTTNTL